MGSGLMTRKYPYIGQKMVAPLLLWVYLPCLANVLADIFRSTVYLKPGICGKFDILFAGAKRRKQHTVFYLKLAVEVYG